MSGRAPVARGGCAAATVTGRRGGRGRPRPAAAYRLTALLLLGAAAPVLTGCTNQQPARFAAAGARSHSTVTASAGAGGVQRIVIDATSNDRFIPDTVVVHPGRVTLVVRNTGAVPHTLEIPSLGVDTGNIGKLATRQVTFTVTKPGRYPFDCAYHVTLGMDGVLVVR